MQKPLARNAEELDRLLGRFLRRYAFVRLDNIASFAERLAEFLKAPTLPRDPFQLLPSLGIRLRRRTLSAPSRAIWTRTDNCYTIYCAAHESSDSVAFSLWHEFFEILAHHPNFPTHLSPFWEERLANKFATNLLMPEQAVRQLERKFASNPDCLVPVLAEKYGVSRTAMRKRLQELGLLLPRSRHSRPQRKHSQKEEA